MFLLLQYLSHFLPIPIDVSSLAPSVQAAAGRSKPTITTIAKINHNFFIVHCLSLSAYWFLLSLGASHQFGKSDE
jgi:hypothetical protein